LGSYYLQTINLSLSVLLAAAGTIVFSLAIWTLNHEFRPDLETVKKFAAAQEDARALATRRSAGRGIWNITRILCYSITLFTIAFSAYRFLP
jgi:hypothetical protein